MDKISTIICNFLWWSCCFKQWFLFYFHFNNPQKEQNKLLLKIIKKNKNTLFGLDKDFSAIKTVSDFQKRISINQYEYFNPYIEKIKNGEDNILTKAKIKTLEPTSGSNGASKYIPYNEELKNEFQKGIKVWIFDLFLHHPKLFLGKSYWSITPKTRCEDFSSIKIGFEEDSEYFGKIEKYFVDKIMVSPNFNNEDFLETTKDTLKKEKDKISLISIWSPTFAQSVFENEKIDFKNLQVISAWADGNSTNYTYLIEKYFPETKFQPKGLLSTECITSFPLDKINSQSILSYRSHFFEFLDKNDEIALLNEVKKDKQYSVIVTTSGGLYRYNTNDVIQITGFYKSLPIVKFISRSNNVSDFFGEKLNEVFVKEICEKLFAKHNLNPKFFMMNFDKNHYVLNIESDFIPDDFLSELETQLETNYHYKNCVELNQLKPVQVKQIKDGIDRYNKFCVDNEMRLGDIKPKVLDVINYFGDFSS